MRALFVLALLLSAAPSTAAIGYSRFTHPQGEYTLEHPAEWKRSLGLQTLLLRPSGRDGGRVRVSIERRPIGKGEASTAEAFERDLLAKASGVKKLESQTDAAVSERRSRRLVFRESAELRGGSGQKLEGPLQEVYLLVQLEGVYYVLKLEGIGPGFKKALPEFDRLAKSLRFGPVRREP